MKAELDVKYFQVYRTDYRLPAISFRLLEGLDETIKDESDRGYGYDKRNESEMQALYRQTEKQTQRKNNDLDISLS